MAKAAKRARQTAAITAAMERTLRRVSSLAIALMRADAAYEKGAEAMSAATARGISDDQAVAELLGCTNRVENNDLTRASGLLALHLASIYAVAEKWRVWQFADPEVDPLLDSPHLAVLEEFRHGVFHIDPFDAASLTNLATRREVIEWSRQLASAFRKALRAWSTDPRGRMTEHLLRVGP